MVVGGSKHVVFHVEAKILVMDVLEIDKFIIVEGSYILIMLLVDC